MDPIKRAVLNELIFTFKDCDDNLDLILKIENREEIMTKEQLLSMLDDVLDQVAENMAEYIYEYIDNNVLEFMSEIIDASF